MQIGKTIDVRYYAVQTYFIATEVYFYKGIVIVCELHTKMKFKKNIRIKYSLTGYRKLMWLNYLYTCPKYSSLAINSK